MIPARVIPALVVPVWRTLPWRLLGAAGAVGLLVVGLPRLSGAHPDPWTALALLRSAALAFALGLAFLLDDPARHTTTPVPTGRAARTALRVALVAPVAAPWWTAVLLLAPGAHLPPAGAATLEAGAACVLALAAATVAVHRTDDPRPGPPAAIALLTAALLAPLAVSDRSVLFVGPRHPRWATAHEHWAWLPAGAVTVGCLALGEPLGRFRPTADRRT
ncbi:ABC transporter [Streptomyces corchorusii]|uniref:ABC transporter n=2 Tax=Streptomyces TaxID=1883 RepID=A0A117QDL0_STRCK|nr:hypothetical protein [Streptomyces corchorusii]KUN22483.1 ABC transporter [Streptomyces corchorusii]